MSLILIAGGTLKSGSRWHLKESWHRVVKDNIRKETRSFSKKIGSTNPDIGINSSGNIVLRNPDNGKSIVTDVLADWFIE